jgi:hypothetical protein
MGEETSIINFGELAKPATVLIEKISDALGGAFRPFQIKRVANAEAEAAMVHVETEIKITELHRRAMHRFFEEEAKKQQNIEAITEKALPQLESESQPQKMDRDWISNFFDKCRIVSDDEMQQLWGKVLAGEANNPGTYSKRTVNFIGSLDKQDAILFSKLCGFGWMPGNLMPLVYDSEHCVYTDQNINFTALTHLDNIGLITFQNLSGFRQIHLPKRVQIHYFGHPLMIEFRQDNDNVLDLGKVLLTQTGEQLARICGAQPVNGFVDFVLDRWIEKGYAVASPYPRVSG